MKTKADSAVLYVDDEEANLFLLKVNLQPKYKVFTAISGMEALEILDKHKEDIQLVITDMRMPKMNGVQFIQKARETHDDIPYFVLTGFDYNDEINAAIEARLIDKFFTKPYELRDVETAIAEAIRDD